MSPDEALWQELCWMTSQTIDKPPTCRMPKLPWSEETRSFVTMVIKRLEHRMLFPSDQQLSGSDADESKRARSDRVQMILKEQCSKQKRVQSKLADLITDYEIQMRRIPVATQKVKEGLRRLENELKAINGCLSAIRVKAESCGNEGDVRNTPRPVLSQSCHFERYFSLEDQFISLLLKYCKAQFAHGNLREMVSEDMEDEQLHQSKLSLTDRINELDNMHAVLIERKIKQEIVATSSKASLHVMQRLMAKYSPDSHPFHHTLPSTLELRSQNLRLKEKIAELDLQVRNKLDTELSPCIDEYALLCRNPLHSHNLDGKLKRLQFVNESYDKVLELLEDSRARNSLLVAVLDEEYREHETCLRRMRETCNHVRSLAELCHQLHKRLSGAVAPKKRLTVDHSDYVSRGLIKMLGGCSDVKPAAWMPEVKQEPPSHATIVSRQACIEMCANAVAESRAEDHSGALQKHRRKVLQLADQMERCCEVGGGDGSELEKAVDDLSRTLNNVELRLASCMQQNSSWHQSLDNNPAARMERDAFVDFFLHPSRVANNIRKWSHQS